MIVWATEFPCAPDRTALDLLDVAKEWLVGSPHLSFIADDFDDEPLHRVVTYQMEDHEVSVGRTTFDGEWWMGLRHSWIEDGEREWSTDVVGHEGEEGLRCSIRLNCNLLVPGLRLPRPKKPYIVKLVLQRIGGGLDGGMQVDDEPTVLQEASIDRVAGIIRGSTHNKLPVVYVSADNDGWAVDVEELARWLSGMAHVVVEPSRTFSLVLSRQVNGANAYGGAVAIYWPGGAASQVRFLPGRFPSRKALQDAVAQRVQKALSQIQPESRCTWSHLKEVVSRNRIDELREAESTEVDDWVEAFADEAAAKDERIATLEDELNRMRGELMRLEHRTDVSGDSRLSLGDEVEFYAGEVRDTLIEALERLREYKPDDYRRYHLAEALLAANGTSGFSEQFTQELKDRLGAMSEFGRSERKTLERLGFVVDESGRHVRATFREDARYSFTIPKTGSDHRGGRNLVGVITRTLFG